MIKDWESGGENMTILDKIEALSDKYEDYIIDMRRRIHSNPELSFREHETSSLVIGELEKLNIQTRSGIAGNGVLGVLQGHEKGKTVLLRADMDALPIQEELDVEFKSRNPGVMHACGHDIHTANLLGVAKILSDIRLDFKGTVMFMFQTGEEKGGGCKKMLDDGLLGSKSVDAALALHVMPVESCKLLLSKGNITANSDGFTIKIFGKSAHASRPQDGVDAIHIAGHVIVGLNSILSKNVDPGVSATFSIGKIKGGRANNIVPDYVELTGMIRADTEESRDAIRENLNSISRGIAESFGGHAETEVREGYPSIVNDEKLVDKIRDLFSRDLIVMGESVSEHKPLMTADDFGYISRIVPSVYYMVGTGDYAPQHSSKFFVDEKCIKLCTRTMAAGALRLLDTI
ncbi:putative hydrolase YxeP [Andreesenia angusta]|uniref:Putative hydrolase YxeP n=2 Tax=Andreesenia angusta TaxID=39480 RepID=A0A1S1V8G9_9FIRM|nr:putative hydrolase YxeP [Andreesenia angusta]